jgi:hypothetical protein
MTVVQLPVRARWAWDARGDSRAVRVSPHVRENLVNLSLWRDDVCVGTVRLLPGEAANLVAGLSEGLAQLAAAPPDDATRLRELEERLAELESRLAAPAWRAMTAQAVRSVRHALVARVAGRVPTGLRRSPDR